MVLENCLLFIIGYLTSILTMTSTHTLTNAGVLASDQAVINTISEEVYEACSNRA